nr:Na/Pi cotransporter family protein [Desulfobulbaceae bacterium]
MNVDFWKLLAGLGLFIFGMFLLEEAVRAFSGKAFRRIIRQYTNGRLKSIVSGTFITAILQSSSAVSLMVLAFVGAGVMSMENAIGVIMGSNIGTTLTAWIVAAFGFKLKIETFALPFIGIGGLGLISFGYSSKASYLARLFIGFGFLFLGLDYMKGSVETLSQTIDLAAIANYGLWLFCLIGIILTAIMHSSAASVAIALTALHGGLITFETGAALVIGANVGTTITILMGSLAGSQPKKRVALSHLIFNITTAIASFAAMPLLIWIVKLFINVDTNSLMALAFFHTLFNITGVVIFFPFIGLLSKSLIRFYPDHKTILTVYLGNMPNEVTDAAGAALRNEVKHLFQECQLYNLRLLKIDEGLVFDEELPFEKNAKKRETNDTLYENIKLLHAEIFAFYSRVMSHKIDESDTKEMERVIFASRNIMNSIKNFKGIRHNFEEFEGSDSPYLNGQYKSFRKRLLELYHDINRFLLIENQEEQYKSLVKSFIHVEQADRRFIKETMTAVASKKIHEMEISSLLLVNRLFNQACRLQVFSLKDLLLSQEQISDFDKALDMKEIIEEAKAKDVVYECQTATSAVN